MKYELCLVYKCIFTPSGIVYNIQQIESTNRLYKLFKDQKDYFIRVSLLDDNLSFPKKMEIVT